MTLSITALSIMTLSIMTLNITIKCDTYVTALSRTLKTTQHNATPYLFWLSFKTSMNSSMLSVVMLSIILLGVIMQYNSGVILLSVFMLSVFIQNFVASRVV